MTLARELRFRLNILTISIDRVMAHLSVHVKSDARGLIGTSRWFINPKRYSIAHMDPASRLNSPYGSTWVPLESGTEICSVCRTGRPIDFVRFASKYHRWDPSSAQGEIEALIKRGELSDDETGRNRWRIIPQGSMLIYTTGLEERQPVLTAITHEGNYYSMATNHLIDLPEHELDVITKFFSEVIPEWTFNRTKLAIQTAYDGNTDPMRGHSPSEFQFTAPGGVTPLSVIYTEEK